MSVGYDFWLLDLDGTLVDVESGYAREVLDRVGERVGYSFTAREVEVLWNGLTGSRNEFLRGRGIDPEPFWRAFHEEEDSEERADATFLYDDAAVVRSLEGPVGLVTHCQRYLTEPVLAHLDIADWFDTVVCCDDDLGWKPDPAPVEHAMGQLGVGDTGDVGVLVGDGPQDVGAAWNAGLDGVHVTRYDDDTRGHCVLADRRVERLDELA